jgi:hypothetical protein
VVPIVVVSLVVLVGSAALAIDLSRLTTAYTELQTAADASALAGAETLMAEQRLRGGSEMTQLILAARGNACQYASLHTVLGSTLELDLNSGNSAGGDLVIGYLADPTDRSSPLDLSDPVKFNTVQVLVRRDEQQNGSIALTLARILGFNEAPVRATATATFQDGIIGFSIDEPGKTAGLMPLALHVDAWANLLANGTTDNFAYDPDSQTLTPGADGVPELNLYPGSGTNQLPPGNFGTVDIGSSNNSTADISRQILEGVNADDLAYFGGELTLGDDGTLILNGDTGLSAAIKDDLNAIKGDPRTIPLFSAVSGPGNNAQFTVVAFAGIRIVNVKLTGPMSKKEVIIQPAVVVDETAVGGGNDTSFYVYRPLTLCR